MRSFTRPALCSLAAFHLLAACGDDPSGNTETAATDSDATDGSATDSAATTDETGTTDGSGGTGTATTGSESSGTDTDDDPKPGLGDTTNVLCDASMAKFAEIVAENDEPMPDAEVVSAAYEGALQDFVRTYGEFVGNVVDSVLLDDKFVLDAIADGSPQALLDAEYRIHLLISKAIRKRTDDVSKAGPDIHKPVELLWAEWDDAYCYWDKAQRVHAQASDQLGLDIENAEDDILAGFETGHDGIDMAFLGIDEWVVKPAKQMVEKSLFRVVQRLVLAWSDKAKTDNDPSLAREAYGLFQLIEDRMEGLNTPGIAIIESYLTGEPSAIDVADLKRQMNIAFAKRTRRYASHAIDDPALLGNSEGYKSAIEGRTYVKLLLPDMTENLASFDPEAHLGLWDEWAQAIQDDDASTAQVASATLTEVLCDYQTYLGISECTSTNDEMP